MNECYNESFFFVCQCIQQIQENDNVSENIAVSSKQRKIPRDSRKLRSPMHK